MADLKITELTENTTPILTDILPMVDDPAGTPVTKKVTLTNIKALGMLNSKIITGTRDMTAATADVAYTDVGFTPTSIIAIGAIDSSLSFAIGFSDSTKAGRNLFQYAANQLYNTGGLIEIAVSSGNVQAAVIKTYDADGFTVTWTKSGSPTGTAILNFLCFR